MNRLMLVSRSGGPEESPAASLLFPGGLTVARSKPGMMGGQAFGTGDFDDDDDADVYGEGPGRGAYNLDIGGR